MYLKIIDTIKGKEWTAEIENADKFQDMIDRKIEDTIDVIVYDLKIPARGSYKFMYGSEVFENIKNINPIISGHNSIHLTSLVFQSI